MAHPLVPEVQKLIDTNPVMVFMKGTADFPMCGFSAKAVAVLKAAGVEKVGSFDLLSDDDMWTALEEMTEWPTSPQVFIKGQFIGGCDIVTEMYENGELQQLLKA
jgi:monothiol glutaredoxin